MDVHLHTAIGPAGFEARMIAARGESETPRSVEPAAAPNGGQIDLSHTQDHEHEREADEEPVLHPESIECLMEKGARLLLATFGSAHAASLACLDDAPGLRPLAVATLAPLAGELAFRTL